MDFDERVNHWERQVIGKEETIHEIEIQLLNWVHSPQFIKTGVV